MDLKAETRNLEEKRQEIEASLKTEADVQAKH